MKISSEKKAFLFLSVGLVFVLALGLMSFTGTKSSLEAERSEKHTFEVISKIKRVSVAVNTMQGEARGYLLTGDEGLLEYYRAAREDYSESIDELENLVSYRPGQLQRIEAVKRLAVERMAVLDRNIGLKRKGVVRASDVSKGEAVNREINNLIDEMISEEKSVLSKRQLGQEIKRNKALLLVIAATGTSVLLVFSTIVIIRGDYARRKRLEDELRKSERKYRVVADNTYAWEFWHAPDGHVLYCSPSCKPICGHEAAEFEKDPGLADRIVHPDDIVRYSDHNRNIQGSKTAQELEFRINCPDGSEKWISQVCRPIFDETGEFLGIRGTNRDITERKRLEGLIVKNARELEDLYNMAPCGYHSLDKDGLFVRMNDTALRWLGYKREEVVGRMRVTDIMTQNSLGVFSDNFPRFKELGAVHDLELEFIRRDGSIMPVLLNATAIKDDSGRFLMSRSTFFDITEARKARNDLIEKNRELHDALSKVRLLSGMLPICASCKKIRDDDGYWNSVEKYIGEHSEAEFTHSICPDCAKRLYPEFYDKL